MKRSKPRATALPRLPSRPSIPIVRGWKGRSRKGPGAATSDTHANIGLAKTRLQHLLIATALNFVRMAVWLAEIPLAQTRRSAFAALATAPV